MSTHDAHDAHDAEALHFHIFGAGEHAFPALVIDAAAPAKVTGADQVSASVDDADPDGLLIWGAGLSGSIATHVFGVRSLGANRGGWTHWLRLFGQKGEAPFVDFVVKARGLPANELEAGANGYKYAELDMTTTVAHHGPLN